MADGFSVVVCATVSTGLESVAVKECKERLGCKSIREGRGRIYFDIPANSFSELKTLRSIENLFVVVKEFQENNSEKLDCYDPNILEKLYKLPQDLDWSLALSLWKQFTEYSGILLKSETQGENNALNIHVADNKTQSIGEGINGDNDGESLADSDHNEAPAKRMKHGNGDFDYKAPNSKDDTTLALTEEALSVPLSSEFPAESPALLPKFRVTCTRTGKSHIFSSPEAAAKFGGGINDWLGWRVDLSNPDIEVLLNIVDNSVVIGIALTKETRGKRNIAHFGPTTLKSSIAYCMLSLANIQPGEIVCDPMCGGGSIPIEGALNWPASLHLCGDHHDLAPPRTLANVQNVVKQQLNAKKTLPLDICQWDVCNLPLKANSVDVFISDLPFGKKSGSKHENWKLYPKALEEMARVCLTERGRAVLLTQDKRVMGQVLNRSAQWKKDVTLWINIGGLKAGIYVLSRTKK